MSEHDADVVVIGSGFGGAVSAARLAQAGLRVVIVERGRRWNAEDFPRDRSLRSGWWWHRDRGLFDVRWLDRMLSVQGAGWGGGSLVYANVFARPPAEVFDERWPSSTSRAALEPYYDLVAHMLEVSPVGPDPQTGAVPARTTLMERSTATLDRPAESMRPQLAVRFGDPDVMVRNRHGAVQAGCRFVGECVLGCPQRAKNTLDHNYLFVAEHAGATARTETEVTAVRPEGSGYRVEATDHVSGSTESWSASAVFFAAGAVATTELLLRMRDVSGDLPDLSAQLGEGFSGNGDSLSFLRRRGERVELGRGPTITSATIVTDAPSPGEKPAWFVLQDGGYPAVLASLVAGMNPAQAATAAVTRALRRVFPRLAEKQTAMTLLMMGRDSSNGRLVLDHHLEAAVRWDNRANSGLYRAERALARSVGQAMGARTLHTPIWTILRRAVTVHNLGGAPVGTDPDSGVVDEHGEVFGYPGLLVVDGASLPGATGANPSATIAALAERRVEHFIRRFTGDETWVPPERAEVVPVDVPEDAAIQRMRTQVTSEPPPRGPEGAAPSPPGVHFTEQMSGAVHIAGRRERTVLDLTVRADDVVELLRDPAHTLAITGTATIGGVVRSARVTGTLSLFPDASAEAMRYTLGLVDDAGNPVHLVGLKHQRPHDPLRLWGALTTLHLQLNRPSAPADASGATGVVRIGPIGAVRLAASLRGIADDAAARRRAVTSFLSLFARGTTRGLLGWRRRPSESAPAVDPLAARR